MHVTSCNHSAHRLLQHVREGADGQQGPVQAPGHDLRYGLEGTAWCRPLGCLLRCLVLAKDSNDLLRKRPAQLSVNVRRLLAVAMPCRSHALMYVSCHLLSLPH